MRLTNWSEFITRNVSHFPHKYKKNKYEWVRFIGPTCNVEITCTLVGLCAVIKKGAIFLGFNVYIIEF